MDSATIKLHRLIPLFFSVQLFSIFEYFLKTGIHLTTYLYLGTAIYILIELKKGRPWLILMLVGGYSLIEVIIYPDEGVRQYMSAYYLVIVSLISLPVLCLSRQIIVEMYKIDRIFLVLTLFVIIGQFGSLIIVNKGLSFLQSGNIKNGALYPHEIGYFCITNSLYFIFRKKRALALVLLICGILLGRRTTLLLSIINFVILILTFEKNNHKLIWGLILVSVTIYFGVDFYGNKLGVKSIQEIVRLKPAQMDPATNKLSNGRNLIWTIGIEEIKTRPILSGVFVFGEGPRSSVKFNKSKLNLAVWMHNDFLDVLFCLGYFGIALYLAAIVYFVWITKSLLALLYITFMGLFNGFMHYYSISILVVFILLYLTKQINNEEGHVHLENITWESIV